MENNEELKYWLAFAKIKNLRHKQFLFFRKKFQSLAHFWHASVKELLTADLPQSTIQEIIQQKNTIYPEKALAEIKKNDIQVITYDSAEFPPLLKQIACPPLLLFCRGNIDILKQNLLAIVGTRKFSSYGKIVSEKITQEALDHQLIPISGLALGIDALVHNTCVQNKFSTLAVLGAGVDNDNIYPRQNFFLAQQIIKNNGLIISEYAPGTKVQKYHFPARNRLISGLSLGTLVTEAKEKSGALITAHFALEQNREVFAIPGPINSPTSYGTNKLIQQGAKLVSSINDVLEELNLTQVQKVEKTKPMFQLSPEEQIIVNFLSGGKKHINEIAQNCNIPTATINSLLIQMELSNRIKNNGNLYYSNNI